MPKSRKKKLATEKVWGEKKRKIQRGKKISKKKKKKIQRGKKPQTQWKNHQKDGRFLPT